MLLLRAAAVSAFGEPCWPASPRRPGEPDKLLLRCPCHIRVAVSTMLHGRDAVTSEQCASVEHGVECALLPRPYHTAVVIALRDTAILYCCDTPVRYF